MGGGWASSGLEVSAAAIEAAMEGDSIAIRAAFEVEVEVEVEVEAKVGQRRARVLTGVYDVGGAENGGECCCGWSPCKWLQRRGDKAWADCGGQRSDDGLQRAAVIDLHMQNKQTALSLVQIFRWVHPIWNVVEISLEPRAETGRAEDMEIPYPQSKARSLGIRGG